jgi:hypothetical protein
MPLPRYAHQRRATCLQAAPEACRGSLPFFPADPTGSVRAYEPMWALNVPRYLAVSGTPASLKPAIYVSTSSGGFL